MHSASRVPWFATLVLLVVVVYMAAVIVRIENERYALSLGMCLQKVGASDLVAADFACLDGTQTRTGWLWHLYYALK